MLVLCTGCLQPNPKFVADGTEDGDEVESTVGFTETTAPPAESSSTGSADPTSLTADPSSGPSTDATTTSTDDGDPSESSTTTGVADEHTIFVSSADFAGDFRSIAAVDELCTQLATDAGLAGDTWRAIVSDSTVDARDRIVVTGPIRNVMGELIAENHDDLWDGFIAAPVQYTEFGEQFLASPLTGTNTDGTAAADNCNDWTTAGGASGVVGDAGFASEIWIDAGTGSCGQSYPFYCISQ